MLFCFFIIASFSAAFSFLSVELPGVTAAPRALGGVELLLFHPDAEVSAAPSLVTDKDIFSV